MNNKDYPSQTGYGSRRTKAELVKDLFEYKAEQARLRDKLKRKEAQLEYAVGVALSLGEALSVERQDQSKQLTDLIADLVNRSIKENSNE